MTVIAFCSEHTGRDAVKWSETLRRHDPDLHLLPWDEALSRPEDVEYALVWMPPPGDLARFPNLKAILSLAAGVDHVVRKDPDWPSHLPLIRMGGGETADLMSDYVQWACLSLLRLTPQWAAQQRQHAWKRTIVTRTFASLTIGVMGLGHLGTSVATHLAGAGAQLRGWSRSRHNLENVETFAGPEELHAFSSGLDILICLLPDTPETRGIIGHDLLSRLAPGAGLINVARGTHVRTDDLLALLDNDHLSAAILDVFDTEPLPASSPLWDHPKIVVTPHIASQASTEARAVYIRDVIQTIESGRPPALQYQPVRGY